MSKGNGNGAQRKGRLHVPEGLDPLMAEVVAGSVGQVVRTHAPLTPPAAVANLVNGILADLPRITEFTAKLLESPRGARWGIGIKRNQLIETATPVAANGLRVDSFVHIADCQSADDIVRWATTNSMISSLEARALIALTGFQVVLIAPSLPDETEQD